MLRKLTFFLLCLLGMSSCFAQETDSVCTPGTWSLSIKMQYGFLMTHRPTIIYLQQKHTRGLEINYLRGVDGQTSWMTDYNQPLLGFGFQYFNLGNPTELGNAYSLFPEIMFPLSHHHHLRSMIKFGLGIGYVTKPYDIKENYKNLAVGSKLNVAITTGLQFRIFSSDKLQIITGADFSHFSNGASNIPNAGINIVTANLGVNYYFGNPSTTICRPVIPANKKWETSSYIGFGIKDIYPPQGPKYAVVFNTTDLLYHATQKSLFGGGFDFILDQSLKHRLELDSVFLSNAKAGTRIGIHGSYGLRVGRVTGVFQTGYYVYNKVTEDGNIFSRLSLRYFLNDNYFVCFNLKTHFAKADYFEFGFGYRF
ncbi:acyloxyacyl hydrolase [soil metagenome]